MYTISKSTSEWFIMRRCPSGLRSSTRNAVVKAAQVRILLSALFSYAFGDRFNLEAFLDPANCTLNQNEPILNLYRHKPLN